MLETLTYLPRSFWNVSSFVCKCRSPLLLTSAPAPLSSGGHWIPCFLFLCIFFTYSACVCGPKQNSNLDISKCYVNGVVLYGFFWISALFTLYSTVCLRQSSMFRQLALVHYCHSCVVFYCMKIPQFVHFTVDGQSACIRSSAIINCTSADMLVHV